MTTKEKEIIGTSISLLLLTALFFAAALVFMKKHAETNHEEPTPPDYKIETERGFEYPKY